MDNLHRGIFIGFIVASAIFLSGPVMREYYKEETRVERIEYNDKHLYEDRIYEGEKQ